MTSNEHQLQLHPAADAFRNHLLMEVRQENEKLTAEIRRLEPSRKFLAEIEVLLARSGGVISASLGRSIILNDYNGLPCFLMLVDSSPCPLFDFGTGIVSMAGQPIGGFPGPEDPILIFNGGDIGLKLFVSMSTVIEGKLRGLHSEDIARFEDETYGDDRIATFLKTGQGLRSPSAIKFLPDAIYMVITPELEDTVRVLGPFPKYNTLEDVGGEPLPVAEGVDCPEAPPPSEDDESRLAIVTALGSSEAQMEVLEENQRLKTLRCRFLRVQDKICTIELFNAIGKSIPPK